MLAPSLPRRAGQSHMGRAAYPSPAKRGRVGERSEPGWGTPTRPARLSSNSPDWATASHGRLQIGGAGAQPVRLILEEAEGEIAGDAQEAAHPSGRVAMIDVEPAGGSLPADRANTALPCQHGLVVGERHPV